MCSTKTRMFYVSHVLLIDIRDVSVSLCRIRANHSLTADKDRRLAKHNVHSPVRYRCTVAAASSGRVWSVRGRFVGQARLLRVWNVGAGNQMPCSIQLGCVE